MVLLGNGLDERNYRRLMAFAARVRESAPAGLVGVIPAYDSVLVSFDPRGIEGKLFLSSLERLSLESDRAHDTAAPRIVELPVVYGGEFGPDLASLAAARGMSEVEAIAMHSGTLYPVYLLGFSPGFPYLGNLDPRLATPRLATPRTKVPAGSVGIADAQTGVYPQDSPGGWNIIGRTGVRLFDPCADPPALLAPGDYVRFIPTKSLGQAASAVNTGNEPGTEPPRPGITVISPGLHSSIQDRGRFGYEAQGVPRSGAMDERSLALANLLVGNEPGEAGIECLVGGIELRFDVPAVIAVCGAAAPLELNGKGASREEALSIQPGDVLRAGMADRGMRVYLAVRGGLAVEPVLGSRSTYERGGFGGLHGRPLAKGDRIPLGIPDGSVGAGMAGRRFPDGPLCPNPAGRSESGPIVVRAMHLFEAVRFEEASVKRFFSEGYTVGAQSDRMGLRLAGAPLAHTRGADIASSPVLPGTVQIPGDGQAIVLMADGQTTGGYTRIAQVAQVDLPLLAQARPGDAIRFVPISVAEAAALAMERDRLYATLAQGLPKASPPGLELIVTVNGVPYSVRVEES